MKAEFDRVRAAASHSLLSRTLSSAVAPLPAAWRSSILGRRLMGLRAGLASTSTPNRVRWCGTAVAVAAAAHLALRSFMPAAVVPAMPAALFLVVAAGGAAMAWKAEAFHLAWEHSRLARLFR